MAGPKMHADQIETDAALVSRLLARQFPQWADLPITPVASSGTDHDIYRLAGELAVRLPRIAWAGGQPASEARWLPWFAPHLPLAVPVPLAVGQPDEDYPFEWAVQEWLPGENANGDASRPRPGRGRPRRLRQGAAPASTPPGRTPAPAAAAADRWPNATTASGAAVAALGDRIDRAAVLRSWEELAGGAGVERPRGLGARRSAARQPAGGRRPLSAVIDFGGLNVGDPACDLAAGLEPVHRPQPQHVPRRAGDDGADRLRGRGLGAVPGGHRAALLLGHQPRHRAPGPPCARGGPGGGRRPGPLAALSPRGLRRCRRAWCAGAARPWCAAGRSGSRSRRGPGRCRPGSAPRSSRG